MFLYIIINHKRFQLINAFLSPEKDFLWHEYFTRQAHLSLTDLLNYHASSTNSLIQITTNSKLTLLGLENRQKLTASLRPANLEFCILKSFDTMLQFSSRIKHFLDQPHTTASYLFIQTDLSHDNNASDLISCARHAIVENFKGSTTTTDSNLFIVLLINVPKEHVAKFIGFQLSHWSCYHLDEVDQTPADLPAFDHLRNTALSQLLSDSLATTRTNNNLDMGILLKKLAHSACSLIKDTNLARTISRIDVFLRLCDDPEFVAGIGSRLIRLQAAKEADYMANNGLDWLVKEAASSRMINEYSTLRRSCQFYLQSRLSPLLAFILSVIDQYSNLETLAGVVASQGTVRDLWLSILGDEEVCRIEYADMRSGSAELTEFKCQSDLLLAGVELNRFLEEAKTLRPRLPFFWLIIEQLNCLDKNLMIQRRDMAAGEYVKSVSQFFEESCIFRVVMRAVRESCGDGGAADDFVEFVSEAYTEDFVLKKCSIKSRRDLEVITAVVREKIKAVGRVGCSGGGLKSSLPLVHYVFSQINEEVEFYLKFARFEQRINEAEFWTDIR